MVHGLMAWTRTLPSRRALQADLADHSERLVALSWKDCDQEEQRPQQGGFDRKEDAGLISW
jgi:hypothetical protein